MKVSDSKVLTFIYDHSKEIAKSAAFVSNPITSIASTAANAFIYLSPKTWYGFFKKAYYFLPLQDKDSEIKGALSHINRFAIFINPSLEGGENTCKKIIHLAEQRLSFQYDLIKNFNRTRTPEHAIQLVIHVDDPDSPASSIGGNAFSPSNPLIFVSTYQSIIKTEDELSIANQTLNQIFDDQVIFDPDIQHFILTHELMHLQNNDCLTNVLVETAKTCVNIWIWASSYSNSSSWFSYLLSSSLKSIVFGAVAITGYSYFERFKETRADLQAVKYLKNNQGAKKFFETLINTEQQLQINFSSLAHPSCQERLQAVTDAILDETTPSNF